MQSKDLKLMRANLGLSPSRTRSRTPSHPRPASQTPIIRKKFTPTTNKSFICYKDKSAPKHSRASSFDKTRDFSGKLKTRTSKSLKNSGKVLISTREFAVLESAKAEMTEGNYEKATELLGRCLKNDGMNLEALYSRGVSFMHLEKYELAIKDFLVVFEVDPGFDKQLYIALYMCYNYTGKHSLGLKVLNKGLRKFPNFSQGFLLRGQIYNKAKKYEKALRDFNKVLNVEKNSSNVIIHIAESYIGLKEYDSAMKALNILRNRGEKSVRAALLKVKVDYETKKLESCLKSIQKVIKKWPEETSVFFFKGLTCIDQHKYTDAVLCFEQVIQGNNDSELVNKSLLHIGKLKIKERDFYGALHTFERSVELGQSKELKAFHKYTEGVICLMKRKLEEGIQIFTEIISTSEPFLHDFLGESYENRGFAYFSLKNYKAALEDFKKSASLKVIEKASEFNMTVSEALLSESRGDHLTAAELLKNCKKLFPRNIMPDLCRAAILVKQSRKGKPDTSLLDKAEGLIDKSLKSREPESEVFFFKSIINFLCKDYIGSYENAKKTIEKADENIASHYVNRAFSNICLKKYEEAIQDLTICLQLKEDLQEIYIFRAICAFLQDDLQLAIDDLKLAQEKFPKDAIFQLKIAKLLTVVGYPKEALEAMHALEKIEGSGIKPDPRLLSQNHLLQNDFKNAKISLQSLPSESHQDLRIINFLQDLSTSPSQIYKHLSLAKEISLDFGSIFNKKYSSWMAGVIFLYNNDFQSASNCFQSVLEILHDEEPEIFADSITIEEENCEILYNLALCSFKSTKDDSKSNALMIFEELSEVLNEKHKGQLLFLSALLHITQKNKKKAEIDERSDKVRF
jgi:tetratricopeptide (TPR) repeat protein